VHCHVRITGQALTRDGGQGRVHFTGDYTPVCSKLPP
jgi:hypothetical protein